MGIHQRGVVDGNLSESIMESLHRKDTCLHETKIFLFGHLRWVL